MITIVNLFSKSIPVQGRQILRVFQSITVEDLSLITAGEQRQGRTQEKVKEQFCYL